MKMAAIAIVIGTLGKITNELVQSLEDLEIREQAKTIQTTALLRSARILRRVPGDLKSLTVTQTSVRKRSADYCEKLKKE